MGLNMKCMNEEEKEVERKQVCWQWYSAKKSQ